MIIKNLADHVVDQTVARGVGGDLAVVPTTQAAVCRSDPQRAITFWKQAPNDLTAQSFGHAEMAEMAFLEAVQTIVESANPLRSFGILGQGAHIVVGGGSRYFDQG